jgi:multiple sugar transport system substrate-binding protein
VTQGDLGGLTPLQLFEHGHLAMLVGSREIVPELRATPGLHFDVMPMPTLGSPATSGAQTGLCISRTAPDPGTAADFLVYASSPPALSRMARTGYMQPANQTVALSNAFLQPGLPPRHAEVFTFGVKSMVYLPLIDRWDGLEEALNPLVGQLFHTTRPSEILDLSRRIDRRSRPVLRPLATESPSPTASPQAGG